MHSVFRLYDACAAAYDRDRSRSLIERPYLEAVASQLPQDADILDLGCGSGEPIARFFIDQGYRVTGVDAAPAMVGLCRTRFPGMSWVELDMRSLDLERKFHAVIAWDSFFHLAPDAQRSMFPIFADHLRHSGLLLFTSGARDGVAIGSLYGHDLYHASLAAAEYQKILTAHGFAVLLHRVEDPDCGMHTVWLARYRADTADATSGYP